MPKTRKTLQPTNLAKYDVYIEDRTPNSQYFNVTNLPQVFTGGRNSFLIGGSSALRNLSNVLIEILDDKGQAVFQNPVPNYIEANARLVSVEVTDSVPPGYLTIILLGTTTIKADGTPVPLDWQDKYNVRWIRRIQVEPNSRNTSPIKLLNKPVILAEEKRFYDVDTSSFGIVNIPITASISSMVYGNISKGYLISAVAPTTFSADYQNAVITGSLVINNITASLRLPITNILNSTTAFSEGYIITTSRGDVVDKLYLMSGSYQTTVFSTLASITSSANLSYQQTSLIKTNIPISYAKLRIVNLKTVSGEIFKTKVYSRVYSNISDYKLIADSKVVTSELLVSSSIRGDIPIGDFFQSPIASINWYADRLETSSNILYPVSGSTAYYDSSITVTPFTLRTNDSVLLRSIYADVPTTTVSPLDISTGTTASKFSNHISQSGYFIGTINPVTLFPSSEYTLQFDSYYKKSSASINLTGITPSVDIYIVGVSGSKIISNNPLGQKIGSLAVNPYAETQWFEAKQFNFVPALSTFGSIGVRFVVSNGFWNFSKISLKPASDRLFAPDEATFLIPNTEYFNDYLQHKMEFFDINNNSTDVVAISIPTFFTGSNIDLGIIP